MRALLAALPIVLLVALLLGARMSGAKAAWISLAAALVLVFTGFEFGPALSDGLARGLVGVVAEGLFIAATILWILLPALAIHEVQARSGALSVLREALARAAPGRTSSALVIGWFFALFLEGAAGFGTPIAVAAPMLVSAGLSPVAAVAGALLGHVTGVTFGAVGTPVLAQAELTPVSAESIARYTAILMLPVAWIPALFVLRAEQGDREAAPSLRWRRALMATVLFGVPYAVAAIWVGPELPTLAGALLGGFAFVALLKRRSVSPQAPSLQSRALLRAALPYVVAIALILGTRLVAPVKSLASSVSLEWNLYGEFSGSILPLYHPGTLLLLALIVVAALERPARTVFLESWLHAVRRLAPAVVALVAMLTLSRLMLHAGMIAELGHAAVGIGEMWPAIAPGVGALGSFVTGSATASNILFTNLQNQAASILELPVTIMLAAQGAGAAVGNAICPHNIIAGAAAVGVAGREGEIMRRTLPACALMLLLLGLLVLGIVQILPG